MDAKAPPLDPDLIVRHNADRRAVVEEDYHALAHRLRRDGIDADSVKSQVAAFSVALPTWGAGTGGTRFARFPQLGEPTTIHEKLADCAVVQQLCRITPRVSPHFPWDLTDDLAGLREETHALGLGFDAVNSNTFQDQPGQMLSYRHGSLSHTDAAVREQAVTHNLHCIRLGQILGSKALTVWVGDGTNFPGQQDLGRALDRYMESLGRIVAQLPCDWLILIEHKLFEPAFYSTVIPDWGTSLMVSQELGPQAKCLIDLGHHAAGVNIEQIVARLHRAGKLGGFHFNDSKYGDDDLDSGSIDPHRLFLVFNELEETRLREPAFSPARMIDQSHNVTDPLESMLVSAEALAQAYAKALLVDRNALRAFQDGNDVTSAVQTLRRAYTTDVAPLVAFARLEAGGAIDPVSAYRASGWRTTKAEERRPAFGGAGIV